MLLVNHEIPSDKLGRNEIQGHASEFFSPYLSDKHQYTVIYRVWSKPN